MIRQQHDVRCRVVGPPPGRPLLTTHALFHTPFTAFESPQDRRSEYDVIFPEVLGAQKKDPPRGSVNHQDTKMTLTHTQKNKKKSGMTLIELTVVILVLLSLISILFVGARAWKRGSDRSASIMMIRNVQQAVRSFQNINNLNPGDSGKVALTDIFGADKFIAKDPTASSHPAGGDHKYAITAPTDIPALGTLYLTVTGTDAAFYMPDDKTGW